MQKLADADAIIAVAHELIGSRLNSRDHCVVIQNVRNRMKICRCPSLDDYLRFVDRHPDEVNHLISALTIHTTSFFREPQTLMKFQSLVVANAHQFRWDRPFRLLSLGCSTGEEVYSYAFILQHLANRIPQFDYRIVGWDIDPVSIQKAERGEFMAEALAQTPDAFIPCLPLEVVKERFRIPLAIKQRVSFEVRNALSLPELASPFDFVSCRNLLIYFKEEEVQAIVRQILQIMAPQAYLCTGVSEQIGAHPELISLGQVTFQKAAQGRLRPMRKGLDAVVVTADEVQADLWRNAASESRLSLEVLDKKEWDAISMDRMKASLVFWDELLDLPARLPQGRVVRLVRKLGAPRPPLEDALRPLDPWDAIQLLRQITPVQRLPPLTRPHAILLGASTGGIEILSQILRDIPRPCPAIVVVQHLGSQFANSFAQRMAQISGLPLGEVATQTELKADCLYVPRGDYHFQLQQKGTRLLLSINREAPVHNQRPSVDVLFSSAARVKNLRLWAVLLTGMGRDGAQGLLELHRAGHTTVAQDENSSTVFGMPREAIRLNAAQYILNPDEIRDMIGTVVYGQSSLSLHAQKSG